MGRIYTAITAEKRKHNHVQRDDKVVNMAHKYTSESCLASS